MRAGVPAKEIREEGREGGREHGERKKEEEKEGGGEIRRAEKGERREEREEGKTGEERGEKGKRSGEDTATRGKLLGNGGAKNFWRIVRTFAGLKICKSTRDD